MNGKKKIEIEIGDRVELVFTNDTMTTLEPGDKGIVIEIDGEPGDRAIWIQWDNGEKLAMLEEIDELKVVRKKKK